MCRKHVKGCKVPTANSDQSACVGGATARPRVSRETSQVHQVFPPDVFYDFWFSLDTRNRVLPPELQAEATHKIHSRAIGGHSDHAIASEVVSRLLRRANSQNHSR